MNENALALARQHAPCYIYSREILTAQAETLHRTFPGFDILFSVKANPFPPVIRHLAALGIGAEGEGMSRLVGESCDKVVTLPMKGKIESLNASVAAGILLYAMMDAK